MKVYLAGAIFGKSDAECKDWRKAATEAITQAGGIALDPMRRDYRGCEGNFTRELVENDLDDISDCDVILVRADTPSWGTAMELVYARMAHTPVIAWGVPEKVSPWLEYHTLVRKNDFESALAELVEIIKSPDKLFGCSDTCRCHCNQEH